MTFISAESAEESGRVITKKLDTRVVSNYTKNLVEKSTRFFFYFLNQVEIWYSFFIRVRKKSRACRAQVCIALEFRLQLIL
jgi:hypothetical protein